MFIIAKHKIRSLSFQIQTNTNLSVGSAENSHVVMSHSWTYVIELVDYLDLLIVKAKVMLVADASYLVVYPFVMDDDLMEVELVAVVLMMVVALNNIQLVERPD